MELTERQELARVALAGILKIAMEEIHDDRLNWFMRGINLGLLIGVESRMMGKVWLSELEQINADLHQAVGTDNTLGELTTAVKAVIRDIDPPLN